MSSITHAAIRTCPNCSAELGPEALACATCHALIYSVRLDQLARDARALEAKGSFTQASELWHTSLTLLPHDSKQAAWVQEHLRALNQAQASASAEQAAAAGAQDGKPKPPTPSWVKRLGPFGPVVLLLLKAKGLLFAIFKLKFLFSFAIYALAYSALYGWRFGVGFAVCILIHEMGHYIDIRRRGLQATLPFFIPFIGAFVRISRPIAQPGSANSGITRRQIAQFGLAGPLAGWIAAAVCFLLYAQTRQPIWAALARVGAWLNILNLIPIWILDGSKAILPLAAIERAAMLALTIGLWYLTGEGIFFLVAAGITFRLFTKDKPEQSDWASCAYYAAVLSALAVVFYAVPNPAPH